MIRKAARIASMPPKRLGVKKNMAGKRIEVSTQVEHEASWELGPVMTKC